MKNLSKALLANAAFSTVTGLLSIILNGRLMNLFELEQSFIFPALGIGLLGFAGSLVFIVRKEQVDKVKSIIIADILWVIGSGLLIAFAGLSLTANLLVLDIAIVVGILAFFQHRFLSRLQAS